MSIASQMLQSAARASRLLPDQAAAQRFLHSQVRPDGSFAGRGGQPGDLYYTGFGLLCARSLSVPVPDRTRSYLAGFGGGDTLDLVHLSCLARCWWLCGDVPQQTAGRMASRLTGFRSGGGYVPSGDAAASTYAAFLATGACQDLGAEVPAPKELIEGLSAFATPAGGFANDAVLAIPSAPATAAAILVLDALGQPVPKEATDYLMRLCRPDGGFAAFIGSPQADLLSTAVSLLALTLAGAPLQDTRVQCRRYALGLWDDRGSFRACGGDPTLDCEYAFYGLLALGCLEE